AGAMITEGGRRVTITPGMGLTAAQALALSQILLGQRQSIVLGASGNAVGGSAILQQAASLSSIHVPHGVSVVRDFAGSSLLGLADGLTNSGNFYAVSTSKQFNTATIVANQISNTGGALLTTVLPQGGLSGFGNAIDDLSFSLRADRFTNAGTISSAGDLSLSAAGSSLTIDNRSG